MSKTLKEKYEDWRSDPDGLQSWLENPHWAGYYEEAPTDACKAIIALEFYYSDTEDDEAVALMKSGEKKLGLEALEYLAKYAGNTPRKGQLLKLIAELNKAS